MNPATSIWSFEISDTGVFLGSVLVGLFAQFLFRKVVNAFVALVSQGKAV